MTKIIECPRDAMQGIHNFIPTEKKIQYINSLLQVGFDTLDCGSFVSAKAIPQMADTAEVISSLDISNTKTKLLVIVANERGAEDACKFDQITYLGFPFSVSETFQQRNTNSTIAESLKRVEAIQNLCTQHNKQLVIYFSMAFGNPYNDPWSVEVIEPFVEKMIAMNINIISLADTVGVAKPADIEYLFKGLIPKFPKIEFGAHLHSRPDNWREKVSAAYNNGCRRFDGAIKGYGGCPMAQDDLVGNMPTENLISYLEEMGEELMIDKKKFAEAMRDSTQVFNS